MKRYYWIDFNGFCRVRAQTKKQALDLAYGQLAFINTADIDNFSFNIENISSAELCESEDENNV